MTEVTSSESEPILRSRFVFDWRTQVIEVGGSDFGRAISPEAQEFIWLASGCPDKTGPVSLEDSYGHRWVDDPQLLTKWVQLPRFAQIETLIFVMAEVHEVIHHVDFLCTPFAVNLHSKIIREYWALQDFAPILLDRRELMPNRMIEFEAHANQLGLKSDDPAWPHWRRLRGPLMSLLAYGDGRDVWPHEQVIPGWEGNHDAFYLFGEPFDKVCVSGFFYTLRPQGQHKWYMRPLIIFETRAVANMVLWALEFVGDDARPAIAETIQILYGRDGMARDYLGIIDLFSQAFKFKDFEDAILSAKDELRHLLILASAAGWYSLHASAIRKRGDLLATNPILRLITAVRGVESLCEGEPQIIIAAKLLEDFDRSDIAHRFKLATAAESIQHSRALIVELRKMNQTKTRNPEMRAHFAALLDRIAVGLGTRDDSYISHLGMPESGNPLSAPELRDEKVATAITSDLKPASSVRDWFRTRDSIHFSFAPRSEKARALFEHFGLNKFVIICNCGALIEVDITKFIDTFEIKCSGCDRTLPIEPRHVTRVEDSESTSMAKGR